MQCTCNLLKNILYILQMDMDLNFLIDLKSSVEQLILISKQIQDSREHIYSKRNHQTNNIVINYYSITHYFTESKTLTFSSLLKDINTYIKESCQHEWIEDWIDLTLDKSKRIEYCKICNITK